MTDRHNVILDACSAISDGDDSRARNVLAAKYPFQFEEKKGREYGDKERLSIFVRDGFVDRYSGAKLVFSPVLRVLSIKFPSEFPYHLHWKMSQCHLAYWELVPTVDHVVPVSRGGSDEESNWVCTSQLRNSAKANWLLEELGWVLKPPGNIREWDGMLGWFVKHVASHENLKHDRYIAKWYKLVRQEIED